MFTESQIARLEELIRGMSGSLASLASTIEVASKDEKSCIHYAGLLATLLSISSELEMLEVETSGLLPKKN